MTASRFFLGAFALSSLVAAGQMAQAGALSPALARLAAERAPIPQKAVARTTATGHGNPTRAHISADGRVQVYIHYRPGERPSAATLAQLGATGVRTSLELGIMQAWVPISRLQRLADLGKIRRISLPMYAYTHSATSAITTGLNIDSQALTAERITALHQAGITGTGVKVGVISNGVSGLSESQNAGYLPPNVWVDPNLPGSGAEGTAMLEVLHAAAPSSALGFCGANTTVEFLTCYDDLAQWGANIIVDDLAFPMAFIYGYPDAQSFLNAVTTFAQNHADINLVTAVGNDQQDYFQGTYTPNTNPNVVSLTPTYTVPPSTGGVPNRTYRSALDFGKDMGGAADAVDTVTIGHGCPNGGCQLYAIATWNDPTSGPYDDLDLFLVRHDGTVVTSSTLDQESNANYAPGSASYIPPAEVLTYTNTSSQTETFYLAILCYSCPNANNPNFRVKLFGNLNGAGTFSYDTNGSVAGHAALATELTVGAAYFSGTAADIKASMENYSSSGPYLYGDWQSSLQTTNKPDITGIDGVTVSGAGGFSSPFYGTSAAAPNAGAVIALLRSGFPTAASTADGWNKLLTDHANAAVIQNYTKSSSGAGLVDAKTAGASQDAPIAGSITEPAKSLSLLVAGNSVVFSAACSYSGQFPVSYDWNFGSGSGIPDSAQLDPGAVTFEIPGTYTVTFSCSDGLQTVTDSRILEVQQVAPQGGGGGGGFSAFVLTLLAAMAFAIRQRNRNSLDVER